MTAVKKKGKKLFVAFWINVVMLSIPRYILLTKLPTEILSKYDFESEVDVNILGHIFENSLNEIEEIAAQIGGTEADLKKSKRKKDGVFYTPKYITKYIVENTIGKLCEEKKTESGGRCLPGARRFI